MKWVSDTEILVTQHIHETERLNTQLIKTNGVASFVSDEPYAYRNPRNPSLMICRRKGVYELWRGYKKLSTLDKGIHYVTWLNDTHVELSKIVSITYVRVVYRIVGDSLERVDYQLPPEDLNHPDAFTSFKHVSLVRGEQNLIKVYTGQDQLVTTFQTRNMVSLHDIFIDPPYLLYVEDGQVHFINWSN